MIKNLEIINFKCFEHLTLEDIGSVNLISGKNNIGKTSFLETVELLASSDKPSALSYFLYKILKRRLAITEGVNLDFFCDGSQETSISSNLKTCEIKYVDENGETGSNILEMDRLYLSINGNKQVISINNFFKLEELFVINDDKFNKVNVNYISSSKTDEQDIALLLGALVDLNKEEYLNESLSLFDENICALKQKAIVNGIVLKVSLKNKDTLALLSSLGEGVNRYIAILCAIWASKEGVLLIDEIENGIHFSNYKKLWEIIFKTSIEANCQIFVTTHSKECIAAFNEAQFEKTECNTQYFEFYKNLKKNKITASRIDKEELQYSLSHNAGVRG
ncbi:MAG: AAA family ATPase [Methylococcaceae bacterium]|nr:AAA family ATPase [Methylococcaceae bacterium]